MAGVPAGALARVHGRGLLHDGGLDRPRTGHVLHDVCDRVALATRRHRRFHTAPGRGLRTSSRTSTHPAGAFGDASAWAVFSVTTIAQHSRQSWTNAVGRVFGHYGPSISTGKWSIHVISTAFRYLGSRRTAFGRPRRMSSHGSTCWSPTTQARNRARSVGGICKAPNSLTTPETSMSPTSSALNQ